MKRVFLVAWVFIMMVLVGSFLRDLDAFQIGCVALTVAITVALTAFLDRRSS